VLYSFLNANLLAIEVVAHTHSSTVRRAPPARALVYDFMMCFPQ
jgi:hypothetical protein